MWRVTRLGLHHVEFVLTTEQPDGSTETVIRAYDDQAAVPRVGDTIATGHGPFEVLTVDWKLKPRGIDVEVIGWQKITAEED
jgi:hypothetical protein